MLLFRRCAVVLSLTALAITSLATPATAAPRPKTTLVRTAVLTPPPLFGLNVWTLPDATAAQSALGVQAPIVGLFRDWEHDLNFPTVEAITLRNQGKTLLVAWEPWDSWTGTTVQSKYTLQSIISGKHNKRIDTWAAQAKKFNSPVMFRFAPEQNGNWRPWSVSVGANTSAQYIKAWRYVVSRFRTAGATNVKWVWNPIVEVGGTTPMAASFPGENYVDYVAVDGYNWGSTRSWGWQSYSDIFATSVPILKRLAPHRPWMVAEVGCAPGVNKPMWVADMLQSARADGAYAVVWFEFVKETDWRIAADPKVVASATSVLQLWQQT